MQLSTKVACALTLIGSISLVDADSAAVYVANSANLIRIR